MVIPSFVLALLLTQAQAVASAGASYDGIWLGTLRAGVQTLRIGLTITTGPDGRPALTMTSIDQGNVPRPALDTQVVDGQLRVKVHANASFEGTLGADGTTLSGRWLERGLDIPISFFKVDKLPERRRPQQPRPPFPYRSEEVAFDNSKESVHLAGTLTLPAGAGPYPAVLLISGSGATDRDETILGHKPFLVIADYLTRRGIAVLRVDDRGVGQSTGDRSAATSENFAADTLAGVAFLASRPDIDRARIGLIGHSEGGVIAPMVAVQSRDVAFIVLLAGPGLPGAEVASLQTQALLKSTGASDQQLAVQARLQEKLVKALYTDPGDRSEGALRARVDAALREEFPEQQDPRLQAAMKNLEPEIRRAMLPWSQFFMAYDPRPTLRQVRCPVLALNGGNDLQVPPGPNLTAVKAALAEGGNANVTAIELPGLNHLFQTSASGAVAEYGTIEETFAPRALEAIGDWVEARVKR